jgi:hypothetical protein
LFHLTNHQQKANQLAKKLKFSRQISTLEETSGASIKFFQSTPNKRTKFYAANTTAHASILGKSSALG